MYHICFSLDENYSEQLSVAITSLLLNSDEDESFSFYVLNEKMSEINRKKILALKKTKDFEINFIDVDANAFIDFPIPRNRWTECKESTISRPAYFKYLIANQLSHLDKVLYLDCDILVINTLKELYNIDIGENYAAMVQDVENEKLSKTFQLSNYFNTGVMLINLKKWREEKINDRLMQATYDNIDSILFADQDIFNIVFENKIMKLPKRWNYQFFLCNKEDNISLYQNVHNYNIIHFAGKNKPWNQPYNSVIFDEYYSILEKTPFKNNLLKYKQMKYEHMYKYMYDIINARIKEESEHIYNFIYTQMEDSTKRECQYIYKHIYEQLHALRTRSIDDIIKVFEKPPEK